MKSSIISTRLKIIVLVIQLCVASAVFLLLFYTYYFTNKTNNAEIVIKYTTKLPTVKNVALPLDYNVWLIFTKVGIDSPLKYKFHNLIVNLLNVSSVPLKFHIVIDKYSQKIAWSELSNIRNSTKHEIIYFFYNIEEISVIIHEIVDVLTPHFSSKPGTYYSGALFYISLGLHLIAPLNQNLAVILDCDLYFNEDIVLLFDQFAKFKQTALFGLAPELTPVYRHVLHTYRSKHNTTFGDFYHRKIVSNNTHPFGFQGYNSGVVLLNLNKIRQSELYHKLLSKALINDLAQKYQFKGHLGDQDFYTLIGFEYPDLIQTLNCGFNRQLCMWWKEHGYSDVFDSYFECKHKIVIFHGNCNTRIPK